MASKNLLIHSLINSTSISSLRFVSSFYCHLLSSFPQLMEHVTAVINESKCGNGHGVLSSWLDSKGI